VQKAGWIRAAAAKGKANGSAAAPAVAEVVETGPILRKPRRPPEDSPLHVLNDNSALKKRWNEQQRHTPLEKTLLGKC
jgi:hypothetical protein